MYRPKRPARGEFFDPPRLDSDRRNIRPSRSKPNYVPWQSRNEEIKLITNAYNLRLTKRDVTVNEYALLVTFSEGYKDIPEHVLKRNFVAQSIRKLLMEQLMPQIISGHYSAGSIVIEPNMSCIFSSKRFDGNSSDNVSKEEEYRFTGTPVATDLIRALKVDITIRYVRTFSLDSFDRIQKVQNAILHHQLLLSMSRFGSVYFDSEEAYSGQHSRLDLMSGHTRGISISGVKYGAEDQSMIVINCPHSYITGSFRIIDLLATFIFSRPINDVELRHSMEDSDRVKRIPEIASIVGTEKWFGEFCERLNGFKCRGGGSTTVEEANLRFAVTDKDSTSLLLGEVDGQQTMTVQEQFKKIGINLNYPNLPCLKSRSTEFPYYPLEVCTLIAGQKVPIFRLSSAARNHLSLCNKPKPDTSKWLAASARDKVSEVGADQFRSFGLDLSRIPVEAFGSSLPKPTLQYRNQKFEPQNDYWESGIFYQSIHLDRDWCVVDTFGVEAGFLERFLFEFGKYCPKFGFKLGQPQILYRAKQEILDHDSTFRSIIDECMSLTRGSLRLIMFVIDSSSTVLNRLIHLAFDEHPDLSAACLRVESVMNFRQHRSIFRTLIHKLNARLGGTNVVYDSDTLVKFGINTDMMVVGLDVTHPDNELSGVSIVGCAYTYSSDLFKHRSLAWPQTARMEIIVRMDFLVRRLLKEYQDANNDNFPEHLIIYRDGVSHEEFERVKSIEISKVLEVLGQISRETRRPKPKLSYIIAQKRHTMRFYRMIGQNRVTNPMSGTLIDKDVVTYDGREFYLYSNTSPQATARPLHYHVLWDELGIDKIQKLTYSLCFNFGKCSGSLSMPSSLRYAHNAAYEARNRVIAAKEFSENKFYSSKFFC